MRGLRVFHGGDKDARGAGTSLQRRKVSSRESPSRCYGLCHVLVVSYFVGKVATPGPGVGRGESTQGLARGSVGGKPAFIAAFWSEIPSLVCGRRAGLERAGRRTAHTRIPAYQNYDGCGLIMRFSRTNYWSIAGPASPLSRRRVKGRPKQKNPTSCPRAADSHLGQNPKPMIFFVAWACPTGRLRWRKNLEGPDGYPGN